LAHTGELNAEGAARWKTLRVSLLRREEAALLASCDAVFADNAKCASLTATFTSRLSATKSANATPDAGILRI
jgi:hypothetical protein